MMRTAVFQKPDDQRLQFLMDVAAMAENMQPTQVALDFKLFHATQHVFCHISANVQ